MRKGISVSPLSNSLKPQVQVELMARQYILEMMTGNYILDMIESIFLIFFLSNLGLKTLDLNPVSYTTKPP